jgi:hypothetical protein
MQAALDARDDLRRLAAAIDQAQRAGNGAAVLEQAKVIAWKHADGLRMALKRG